MAKLKENLEENDEGIMSGISVFCCLKSPMM
jgi:hypothetical protein